MRKFPEDNDFAAQTVGRRQFARLRTNFPLKIASLSLTVHGHLIDLSLSGARFAAPRPLPHGIEVLLYWPGGSAFGEIAWAEQRYCGVRFCDLISEEVIMIARASGIAVPLSRVQQLAAEIGRERSYRERFNAGSGWDLGSSLAQHFARLELRRI